MEGLLLECLASTEAASTHNVRLGYMRVFRELALAHGVVPAIPLIGLHMRGKPDYQATLHPPGWEHALCGHHTGPPILEVGLRRLDGLILLASATYPALGFLDACPDPRLFYGHVLLAGSPTGLFVIDSGLATPSICSAFKICRKLAVTVENVEYDVDSRTVSNGGFGMPDYAEVKGEMLSILEVVKQYPSELQDRVFEILVRQYLGTGDTTAAHKEDPPAPAPAPASGPEPQEKARDRKRTPTKESFSIVKDLNLRGEEGKVVSFREFFEQKRPLNHPEYVTVAIYYLTRIVSVPAVTADHIWTCYKETPSFRPPKALRQAIREASRKRYGYVDARNMNDIRLPASGEILVEQDLPRSKKAVK